MSANTQGILTAIALGLFLGAVRAFYRIYRRHR